ncbi:S-adenosyl-L-methionine-dependent methyltransferase [Flammula alnicola]|nr:S-adenosyl-L-methionine-dependent methyltransferase [Flammula alnicola]
MAHHHHHHHGESENKDYATANKEYFDANSTNQPDPRWIELSKRAAQAMRECYDFNEESTVVMDFACNTGLVARELAPYAKTIVGVDISQAAVDIFNEAVSNQGIPPEEMRAVCVELKGEEGELDGLKFDVIVCSASYHHFDSINDITRMLAFFSKPGGVLLVVDIMPKDESSSSGTLFPENLHHVVAHTDGFTEESIRAAFDGAGLTDFLFKPISSIKIHDKEATIFIAKGTKPLA